MSAAGTSTLPTPLFHPSAHCCSAQIPSGGRGWHGSLADVCLPFGSSEKGKQEQAGRPLGKWEKYSFRDVGSLSPSLLLQAFFAQY